jgi:hypothetical protein
MGCKYACVCGGNCLKCGDFEVESYCGEAENIYDEMHGTVDGKQQEEEYYNRMEQEYYDEEYKSYLSSLEEEAWIEEQFE